MVRYPTDTQMPYINWTALFFSQEGGYFLMIITRIEEVKKFKFKVYIDEEYSFTLYAKDINQYQLEENKELSSLIYDKLMNDVVLFRAKQKALAILKFMDRTEQELRRKLKEADYIDEIIDRAIDYVNQYGYLNDERLAEAYIKSRMKTKSKLMLRTELIQKGIDRDIINQVINQEYDDFEEEDPELIAIQKAISKKTKAPEELSPEEKQKLLLSLYRKGFDLDKIKQILQN